MDKVWLYLYADTFIFRDEYKLLFYNTNNKKYFEINNNDFFNNLYDHLTNLDNLYSKSIDKEDFLVYRSFFDCILNQGLGNYVIDSENNNKPVSLLPKLKLHSDISRIKYDYSNNQAGYILNYLNELTIYLTGNIENEKNSYYKQLIYPIEGDKYLLSEQMINFMKKLRGGTLSIINLIMNHKYIEHYNIFINYLLNQEYLVNLYLLNSELKYYNNIYDNVNIKILCFPDEIINYHSSFTYIFLIANDAQLEQAEKKCQEILHYELYPIYVGDNSSFFYNNVFTKKEEIDSLNLNKRDVFSRGQINTNFFGKLTIFPDNKIYSNTNLEALGCIEDSLYELIFQEMTNNYSWFLLRENVEPCKNCRYKYLCPPISNYELVMNMYNSCNIYK